MTKYLNSRPELVKKWRKDKSISFEKDLLATKPEKECEHERVATTPNGWEMRVCPDCYSIVEFKPEKECQCEVCCQLFNSYKASDGSYQEDVCPKCYEFSTPSPLEIEEIETLKHRFMSGKNHCWRELSLQDQKINSLIRNQKKLYQFIKEKL